MKYYEGDLTDGVFRMDSDAKQRFLDDCKKKKDGRYRLPALKKVNPDVTCLQHKYYRGGILPALLKRVLERNPGYEWYAEPDLHEELLLMFSGRDTPLGRVIEKRTSDMDTVEMMIYMESIRNYASVDWDLYIMDAKEWKDAHPEKYFQKNNWKNAESA